MFCSAIATCCYLSGNSLVIGQHRHPNIAPAAPVDIVCPIYFYTQECIAERDWPHRGQTLSSESNRAEMATQLESTRICLSTVRTCHWLPMCHFVHRHWQRAAAIAQSQLEHAPFGRLSAGWSGPADKRYFIDHCTDRRTDHCIGPASSRPLRSST